MSGNDEIQYVEIDEKSQTNLVQRIADAVKGKPAEETKPGGTSTPEVTVNNSNLTEEQAAAMTDYISAAVEDKLAEKSKPPPESAAELEAEALKELDSLPPYKRFEPIFREMYRKKEPEE